MDEQTDLQCRVIDRTKMFERLAEPVRLVRIDALLERQRDNREHIEAWLADWRYRSGLTTD